MSTTMEMNKANYQDKILKLYGVDFAAAASSSVLVTPFISVIDRAIIENANGKIPLGQGLIKGFQIAFTKPIQFSGTPQVRLIFGLYFSTYVTANVVDTTNQMLTVSTGQAAWNKFLATCVVNMTLCVLKDRAFTRMFGVTPIHALPVLTYLIFATRDALTIAASFTVPPHFAQWLQERHSVSKKNAAVTAQLACPAVVQFVNTPLHLLGLDLYNRPGASPLQRSTFVRSEYLKSTVARIGRIGPAFGVGGVGNTYFRSFRSHILL